MRMRKKKYLDERIDACEGLLLTLVSEDRNFETAKEKKNYLDFEELFGNANPVYMEIGCGKGQFVCELAKLHPEYNYLAVEKVGNVIVSAAERAKNEGLQNVRFLKCGAEYLQCFIPEKSIEGLYLNFSCPYPKKAYTSHRLTNERFLNIYKDILKDGAEIHQKTDNMHFFEYSIEEFTKCGFALKNVSLDLHSSDFEGNIVTEYESKFVAEGLPIYRLEAYIKEE
ncbi:MAG: tRNA (guanosine(46)-N7)-methyltransferase TrmB [Clostridia bacterium]|nr:tRNA (guanosine(46)-N7)-methyltransferase TrmB [Clostridia bacterium]MBQ2499972.1 tRNA (guanosine(46)-N7)-methyltransferase TrmB [Clostridia bacterium]MBQ3897486.1 tRNA (guanosine(46)-N7)-methyltransferase TrmB [Clostridia bacterium]